MCIYTYILVISQNIKFEEVFIMPRGDGTGPMGQGAGTGWGRGGCVPFQGRQLYWGRGLRSGVGRGIFGRIMPWNWFDKTGEPTSDDLKKELNYLENQGESISSRINEIKNVLQNKK